MKCIAYISKVSDLQAGVVLPKGMAEIFGHARRRNAERGITGVLSFKKGHYIQVLEGDDAIVDGIYAKIKTDSRHTSVTTILDIPISERFFPNWSMRLLQSLNKDLSFLNFFDYNNNSFAGLDSDQAQLLKLFYIRKRANKKNVLQHFSGETLSLSGWPDQAVLSYSPALISLVAQLTVKQHSYRDLVGSHEFGTRFELDQTLNELNELGLLQVHSTPAEIAPVSQSDQGKGRFYNKMKKFLRMS